MTASPRIPISKRIFDLLLTLPGMVLISPILGLVALAMVIAAGIAIGPLRLGL